MKGLPRAMTWTTVLLVVLAYAVLQVFGKPWVRWFYGVLAGMLFILALIATVKHVVNTARFGRRMTIDEIRDEPDPDRMARLLRYHLGWSPGKIKSEMNCWRILNNGLDWREDDIRQIVKGIIKIF